jgi:hypothetical protein
MRSLALVRLLVVGTLFAACGGRSAPAPEGGSPGGTPAATPPPAAAPAPAPAVEYKTVADVFPEAPEKALVMNNCASCHNVACSAIGQRSDERWNALRDAHKERVSGADVEAIFTYLKTNFGASKPEPKMPPAFLEGGCTPF